MSDDRGAEVEAAAEALARRHLDAMRLLDEIVVDSGVRNSVAKLAEGGDDDAYRRVVHEQGFYVLVQVDLLLKAMDFLA